MSAIVVTQVEGTRVVIQLEAIRKACRALKVGEKTIFKGEGLSPQHINMALCCRAPYYDVWWEDPADPNSGVSVKREGSRRY